VAGRARRFLAFRLTYACASWRGAVTASHLSLRAFRIPLVLLSRLSFLRCYSRRRSARLRRITKHAATKQPLSQTLFRTTLLAAMVFNCLPAFWRCIAPAWRRVTVAPAVYRGWPRCALQAPRAGFAATARCGAERAARALYCLRASRCAAPFCVTRHGGACRFCHLADTYLLATAYRLTAAVERINYTCRC